MAEIKIEKKKPIWPWIILVLVILALLYFFVFAGDEEEAIEEVETEQIDETAVLEDEEEDVAGYENEALADETVAGYLAYVDDEEKMGLDHEYTNNALISLMNAVQAQADEVDYDIAADMEVVKVAANKIQRDPLAGTHANSIKAAGARLAVILGKLQEAEYPELGAEVQEVKTAVENINVDVLTLNQKDQIIKFFDEAADVLRRMSEE